MAIIVSRNSGHVQQGTVIFTVDTEAEMASVPTNVIPGSLAFVIETSKLYILNHKEEWKLKPCCGGGGGGSGTEYANGDNKEYPWTENVTVKTNTNSYNAIVEAINQQLGTTETYLPSEMAAAILSISGGGTPVWRGTQEQYDAMASHDTNTLYIIEEENP